MQKDSFLILGLTEDATQQQIDEAYTSLKKIYQEQRFFEGEMGAEAAKNLAKIEVAYDDCMEYVKNKVSFDSNGVIGYAQIEAMIKNNRLEDAQNLLDKVESRDAEWHYLQSIIYYKRNWHTESKSQLEIAIALDDSVAKYKVALERLNKMLGGGQTNAGNQAGDNQYSQQNNGQNNQQNNGQNNQNQQQNRAGYSRNNQRNGGNTDACCNTCSTLICCDCCCESMGGDCISCC